jgi:tRNA U34 5-carboxymethylaminomethyl modifying enzyme MnmG/GidA
MAGINAALKVKRNLRFLDRWKPRLITRLRSEGTNEPYPRLPRAEFRLQLRIDNADRR